MATNTDIKNALSFPADATTAFITDGRTVGNAELLRIKAWFEARWSERLKDGAGDPREATANDFAAWLWTELAAQVKAWENAERDADNPLAAIEELDAT